MISVLGLRPSREGGCVLCGIEFPNLPKCRRCHKIVCYTCTFHNVCKVCYALSEEGEMRDLKNMRVSREYEMREKGDEEEGRKRERNEIENISEGDERKEKDEGGGWSAGSLSLVSMPTLESRILENNGKTLSPHPSPPRILPHSVRMRDKESVNSVTLSESSPRLFERKFDKKESLELSHSIYPPPSPSPHSSSSFLSRSSLILFTLGILSGASIAILLSRKRS